MASVIAKAFRNTSKFSSSHLFNIKTATDTTARLPTPLTPRLFCTSSPSSTSFEFIKVEKKGEGEKVALITLDRPRALNALCDGLMKEVAVAMGELEVDPNVGCCIITGLLKILTRFTTLTVPFYILGSGPEGNDVL